MNLKPLHDRVIVKRLEGEEKTKGGIYIPDSAQERPAEGEIVAAGKGKVMEDGSVKKLDVKVGDRVIFAKYAGTEITVENEELLIMREEEILGVVTK